MVTKLLPHLPEKLKAYEAADGYLRLKNASIWLTALQCIIKPDFVKIKIKDSKHNVSSISYTVKRLKSRTKLLEVKN